MKTFFLLLLASMLLSEQPFAQSTDWQYKGEQDGIRIYHKTSPGLMHIKLSSNVRVPMSGVATLFADVDNYKAWGYKISESRLLKRDSPTEVWYYAKYDFPWPLEDRDIILHSKMEQDVDTRRLTIVNTPYPAYLPENKGVVRIKNTSTKWIFFPGENGWVYFEQYIATDSAEGLPDWLVKMTIDTGPRETAKAVRKLLQQEKYQRAFLAHIKN